MTEQDHLAYKNSDEYRRWSAIHQRVARGESVTAEEHAFYEDVNRRMDEQEAAELDAAYLARAGTLRRKIAAEQSQMAELRAEGQRLAERVRELESKLDEPMRSVWESEVARLKDSGVYRTGIS